MDQVSRPMLIALAATVVLAAFWFVSMRPKTAEIANTPAAPVTAIAPAKAAAAKAAAADAKIAKAAERAGSATTPSTATTTPSGATTTTPSAATKPATTAPAKPATTAPAKPATTAPAKPATTAPAKPAAKPATASPAQRVAAAGRREAAAVSRDLRRGKVVVLLFWNPESADDVATRASVRGLSLHGGKVAVHVVRLSHVGQFESITRGVTVNQSPVTLVIDPKRRTRAILGLSERVELTQAVDDALARGR